jgi:hypothetical protein
VYTGYPLWGYTGYSASVPKCHGTPSSVGLPPRRIFFTLPYPDSRARHFTLLRTCTLVSAAGYRRKLKIYRIMSFLVRVIQICTPFLQNILFLPYKLESNGLYYQSIFDHVIDHFYSFSLRCCDTKKLLDKQKIPKSFL